MEQMAAVRATSIRARVPLEAWANGALVERCIDGDPTAWRALVVRYERLVQATARRVGLGPDDIADVVQETFLVLLAALPRIEQPEALGSWLVTVARRRAWQRRKAVTDAAELHEHVLVDLDIDERTVNELWVRRALDGLGEPCATLIRLLFLDPSEPSYANVAACLGCAAGNVGPLRSRCLARMRRLLAGGPAGA